MEYLYDHMFNIIAFRKVVQPNLYCDFVNN